MQFIVTGRAIDGLPLPPAQAIAAYKATFEILASGDQHQIKHVWPETPPTPTLRTASVVLPDTVNNTRRAVAKALQLPLLAGSADFECPPADATRVVWYQ
jgi:hypothetical protein